MTPEFRLLCATAQWPPSDDRDAAVREAAAAVGDWELFAALVSRHRLPGLAADGLGRAGVPAPPVVAAGARAVARSSLVYAAEAVRIARAFSAAGIGVAFIKGSTLAKLAYGDLGLKHSRDTDILVAEPDVDAAVAVLLALGYAPDPPAPVLPPIQLRLSRQLTKDRNFIHTASGLVVELHWRLLSNPAQLRGLTPASATRAVALGGAVLSTFEDLPLVIYLCAHGAFSGWARLKWLADVGALVRGRDEAALRELWRAGEAEGVGRCVASALLLCERLLDLPLDAGLRRDLRRDGAVRRLVDFSLDCMTGGDPGRSLLDRPLGDLRLLVPRLWARGGDGYLREETRQLLFSKTDLGAVRLPAGWTFLYPLLRLPLLVLRRLRPARPTG